METTDWFQAIAAVAAGAAAVYAAVRGVSEYQDSMQLRKASMLSEIEAEFRRVLPTLARIEDDGSYQAFGEALAKEAAQQALSEEEIRRINRLDLVLRFFFIFRVKQRWLPELAEMDPVYRYYLHKLGERAEVSAFAARYYPSLLS